MVKTHSAAKSHQSCPTLCDPIEGSHRYYVIHFEFFPKDKKGSVVT